MSGSITFNYWSPSAELVPGTYVEVDPQGTVSGVGRNTVIFGEKIGTGTAAPNTLNLVPNLTTAYALFGEGSMLANMYQIAALNDPGATFYAVPVFSTGLTSLVQTITVTGTPTVASSIALYVSGYSLPIAVTVGQSATSIATAIAKSITQNIYVPCTATASAGVVTVTTQSGGVTAGDTPIVFNYQGAAAGEGNVPGLTLVVATTTPGAADPDLAAGLSAIGSLPVDTIINPYFANTTAGVYTEGVDATEVSVFLSESAGRWNPANDQFGVAISAVRASDANDVSYGSNVNDQFLSVFPYWPTGIQPAYIYCAAVGAAIAASARNNPAEPFTGIQLVGIYPPPAGAGYSRSERETFYQNGFSAPIVTNKVVYIDRAITTYQVTPQGVPSQAWFNLNIPYELAFVSRYIRSGVNTTFQRKILVADGTQIVSNSSVVTPKIILAYALGLYSQLCDQGICQNAQTVAAASTANLLPSNASAVALYLPIQLAGQLEVIGVELNFSVQ